MRRLPVPIIKRPEKRMQFSFRTAPGLARKLRKIAEREQIPLTTVLESLLDHAVEAYEKEKGIDLNEESED